MSLSEQHLIDCSYDYGNHGCHGGRPLKAFKYIKSIDGIETEDDYTYMGVDGFCLHHERHQKDHSVKVKGFVKVPQYDELKLQEAIATVGPIAVTIDASLESFHHYSSGIYYDSECDSEYMNHVVLVVGYGTDEYDQDYYIVKNSWGDSWGEDGYMRLARNHHDHCGITQRPIYPIV